MVKLHIFHRHRDPQAQAEKEVHDKLNDDTFELV